MLNMRRRAQVVVLTVVSAVLFLVVAPVVYTAKFAYSVEIPPQGCSALSCNLSSGYPVNQVCYETLSYYFLGVGGAICHYEKGG